MPVPRLTVAFAALAVSALTLAACGSDSPSAPPSTASSSSPSSPSSSSSSSSSAAATSLPASAGAGRTPDCTDPDAEYCDDFSDRSSGWPTQNTQSGYTQYDPYLGGTYRIGLRGQGTVVQPSPVRLSGVSPTYSVQVDTEVTLGQGATEATVAGLRCWSGRTSSGTPTGFALLINGSRAQITVTSSLSGESTVLQSAPFTGFKVGEPNRVSVQCVQANGASGVEARLAMRVNDVPAVTASYAQSTRNVSWQTTDQLALVGSGVNADVFFDNIAVSPVNI